MRSLRPSSALAILLHAPLCLTLAQAQTASEADFVVTASRSAEATSRSVRPLLVLTAEDIRTAGVSSLPELLRATGLAEVTSNGGLGQAASVFLRGANGGHTLVLIDGVRIGSATSGAAALEGLPLALIERVEVLPGTASSLYGGDALGGVIQVFTRSAQRSPGTTVALTGGSHGLRQAQASHAQRGNGTEVAVGVNAWEVRGFDVKTEGTYGHEPDADGARGQSLNLRLQQEVGAHRLGLQWMNSQLRNRYDNYTQDWTTGEWGGAHAWADSRLSTRAATWQGPLAAGVNSELRLSQATDDSQTHDASPSFFTTRQDQLSWLNRLAAGGGQLVAGLEWLKQKVDSDTDFAVDARTVKSLLLGWRATQGAVSTQIDLRRDANSQYGAHATGQAAVAWQLDPAWRLRLAGGTAFKAPTFNDLYWPFAGNPGLQPEKARNLELGSDWQLGGLRLSATAFRSRITDLIAWQEQADGNWLPANVGQAENTGLSLGLNGRLASGYQMRAQATVQNPRNADTGLQLQRRARQFAALGLSRRDGALHYGSDLSYVGHRFDSANESAASRMGGYSLLAVFAGWKFNPDWALEGRVNNLADKRHESVQGYVTPGREAQLTLRWTPAS
ncbi:TonB-dependent receptor domain-containing protein [Ideonella livida]|uniref:TonB-dependent receptor n=1 Tax=Ideonella livida TaxID=2707176 RepID=A0A7C9PGH2_9BURK|nr:TonB-dependent receptor [Ideonella livida]NDY91296.1 TonB-dependent receptor [Ideonella livida]